MGVPDGWSWVTVLADLTIAFSYFSIPISVACFSLQQELRISYFGSDPRLVLYSKTIIVLVIGFIALCGVTHLIGFLHVWFNSIVVAVVFKILTAVISLTTASFLYFVMPVFLSSIKQMELTKRGLPQAIEHVYANCEVISVHDIATLRFLNVNDAVLAFGQRREIMLSKTLFELIEAQDHNAVRNAVAELKKDSGSTQHLVYHVWNAETRRRHTVEASMFKGREKGTSGSPDDLLVISRDVTDRSEREAAIRERDKADEIIKARMRFLSSIAHDLKTPLTTFKLALDLLQTSSQVPPGQAELLQEADVSLEMISVTIGQAIDFARITDNNQLKPKRTRVNLHRLISKCEKIMSKYKLKSIPITFHIAPEICSHVVTDGEWVWQMCVNLLTNASKYTPKGYIRLNVTLANGRDLPQLPPDTTEENSNAGDTHNDDDRRSSSGSAYSLPFPSRSPDVALATGRGDGKGGEGGLPLASLSSGGSLPCPNHARLVRQASTTRFGQSCSNSSAKQPYDKENTINKKNNDNGGTLGDPPPTVAALNCAPSPSQTSLLAKVPRNTTDDVDPERDTDANRVPSFLQEKSGQAGDEGGIHVSRARGEVVNFGMGIPEVSPASSGDLAPGSMAEKGGTVREGVYLCFSVADTGIGVADSVKPNLFKAFSQGQAMQNQGTGLGLYSIRQKSARLHGTCGVSDNIVEKQGSVFFFAIPYVADNSCQPETPTKQDYFAGAGQDVLGTGVPTGVSRFSIPPSVRNFQPSPPPPSAPPRSPTIAVGTDGRTVYNNKNNNDDDDDNSRSNNRSSADYINTSRFMHVRGGVMSLECSEKSWGPPLATAARTDGTLNGSAMGHETTSSSSSSSAPAQTFQERKQTLHRVLNSGGSGNGLLGGGDVRAPGEPNDTTSTLTPRSDDEEKEEEEREVNAGVLCPPQEGLEGVVGKNERGRGILVVDDTSTVRNLLRRACTNMGYAVETACTGEEALHLLERRSYQLVLCDLQMPVMDGPEFTRRWRIQERSGSLDATRLSRQIIVGMSANTDEADVQICRNCGMDGFCPKPITLSILRHVISDYCNDNTNNSSEQQQRQQDQYLQQER